MTESAFIKQIQDELSVCGALPEFLPEDEIKRIIFQARKFFVENWEQAVKYDHYVIKQNEFSSAEYKRSRIIKMPDCVISVVEVREINGAGRLGNIDRDFAQDKLMASEIFLSNFQGDDLVQRVAQYQYFDLSKAFFLTNISYDHNRNTHELKILGRDPKYDVYIKALVTIPDDKLYNDYYFIRYCTAKAKISLARMMGMFPFQLPGGVQPDISSIKDEGEQELTWILERIDGESVCDWLITFH
jgi:hypothetical protein